MRGSTVSPTDTIAEQDGKECSNLLVLISELYNFQVISCVLVFDVIRHLLSDDLTEFKVELLLKILRSRIRAMLLWAMANLIRQILASSLGKMIPQHSRISLISSKERFPLRIMV